MACRERSYDDTTTTSNRSLTLPTSSTGTQRRRNLAGISVRAVSRRTAAETPVEKDSAHVRAPDAIRTLGTSVELFFLVVGKERFFVSWIFQDRLGSVQHFVLLLLTRDGRLRSGTSSLWKKCGCPPSIDISSELPRYMDAHSLCRQDGYYSSLTFVADQIPAPSRECTNRSTAQHADSASSTWTSSLLPYVFQLLRVI